MKTTIPITRPYLGREEILATQKVISSGWLTQGPEVKEFEDAFSHYVKSRYACAVSSCTAALHMALLAIGVRPHDLVVTVSHSFIATANAIRYCGAEPVFVDIDLSTFNMSSESLKTCLEKYSSRVTAILVVHQMGMPCDLKAILSLASRFNIPVIEDAACAIGSEIKIRSKWERIGMPHGEIACFSFHPRKVITTGEGGMLTTNNPKYDRLFRLLRQHGMSVPDTARHNAKKVIFEEYIITGYNYRMTDIQAAIGIEQMKRLPRIIKERRRIASIYQKKLKDIPWLEIPKEPEYCRTNWQSYPVRIKDNAPIGRNRIMQRLLDAGVSTRRGIMNAHQENSYDTGALLKNSELARDSVILLPIFVGMRKAQIKKITQNLRNV